MGKGNGKNRWRDHKRNALNGVKTHLCKAIRKHGAENFILSIEAEFETQHEAYAFEAKIIDDEDLTYKGYNEAKGMICHVDHDQVNIIRSETVKEQWTQDKRQEQSIRYTGAGNPFFGKTHDVVVKAQIGASVSSNTEAHQKISKALMCHDTSDVTRVKMSASSPTRGKTLEEAYGVVRAEEIKQHLVETQPDRRGENHPRTKLTNAIVVSIRERSIGRKTDALLAIEFDVSERTIYKIRRRETWRHLP